jgi:hypothetical protein
MVDAHQYLGCHPFSSSMIYLSLIVSGLLSSLQYYLKLNQLLLPQFCDPLAMLKLIRIIYGINMIILVEIISAILGQDQKTD